MGQRTNPPPYSPPLPFTCRYGGQDSPPPLFGDRKDHIFSCLTQLFEPFRFLDRSSFSFPGGDRGVSPQDLKRVPFSREGSFLFSFPGTFLFRGGGSPPPESSGERPSLHLYFLFCPGCPVGRRSTGRSFPSPFFFQTTPPLGSSPPLPFFASHSPLFWGLPDVGFRDATRGFFF